MLISTYAYSQPTKYRTIAMSSIVPPSTTYSEWQPCSLLVVHNKQRVTIYSETTQTYDILSSTDEYKDTNGYDTIDFTAINEDGTRVECSFTHVVKTEPKTDELHLYIKLPTFTICYALEDIN
jgi:hypothetical protein